MTRSRCTFEGLKLAVVLDGRDGGGGSRCTFEGLKPETMSGWSGSCDCSRCTFEGLKRDDVRLPVPRDEFQMHL